MDGWMKKKVDGWVGGWVGGTYHHNVLVGRIAHPNEVGVGVHVAVVDLFEGGLGGGHVGVLDQGL